MIIEVKINNNMLIGKLDAGSYELLQGATVSELLDEMQQRSGYAMSQEERGSLVFLLDNQHASPESELHDGAMLRILHKVLGG